MSNRLFSKIFLEVNSILFNDNITFNTNVPKSISKWMGMRYNINNLSYNRCIDIQKYKIYAFRYSGEKYMSDIMFDDDGSPMLILLIPEMLHEFENSDIRKIIILIYNNIFNFLLDVLDMCNFTKIKSLIYYGRFILPLYTIHEKEGISVLKLYEELNEDIDKFIKLDNDLLKDLQDGIDLDILDYGTILMK